MITQCLILCLEELENIGFMKLVIKRKGNNMINSKKNKHSSTKRMLISEFVGSDKHIKLLRYSIAQTKEAYNKYLKAVERFEAKYDKL